MLSRIGLVGIVAFGLGKDNETETAVMESIDALQGSKTLIIAAHRLSTIKNCDRIYEIVDGVAIERTSHNDKRKARKIITYILFIIMFATVILKCVATAIGGNYLYADGANYLYYSLCGSNYKMAIAGRQGSFL